MFGNKVTDMLCETVKEESVNGIVTNRNRMKITT